MIKTVIFDLGGVYFTDGTRKVLPLFRQKYGLAEEVVYNALRGNEWSHLYRKGLISVEEFWSPLKAQWHLNVPTEELSELWASAYVPIPGTVEIVKRLKTTGYELIFLSNNIKERIDYLEDRYHFSDNFKGGVFSHIVKSIKPEPLIYKLVLEKASHPAPQCVFIDDKEEYLPPAQALGMQVILFQDPAQLEHNLDQLGIQLN